MGFIFGILKEELGNLLLATQGEVGICRDELDPETGMMVAQNLKRNTWTVGIDGTPDEIRRTLEAIDPNNGDTKHPPGWFK